MPRTYKEVYVVTKSGERSYWTRVGAAFPNRDGSLNVQLNCLPLDGKLVIRDPRQPGEDDT